MRHDRRRPILHYVWRVSWGIFETHHSNGLANRFWRTMDWLHDRLDYD